MVKISSVAEKQIENIRITFQITGNWSTTTFLLYHQTNSDQLKIQAINIDKIRLYGIFKSQYIFRKHDKTI